MCEVPVKKVSAGRWQESGSHEKVIVQGKEQAGQISPLAGKTSEQGLVMKPMSLIFS
jgi:hypothetical protein